MGMRLQVCVSGERLKRRFASGRRHIISAAILGASLGLPAAASATLEPISVSSIVSNINMGNLLNPSSLNGTVTINTGNGGTPTLISGGTTYNGQIVAQANGSKVAVFAFSGNLTTGNVTVSGGSLPVVIYSAGNMTVNNVAADGSIGGTGTLLTSNNGAAPAGGTAGPGGFAGGTGGAAAYVGLAANGAGPGGGTGGPVQGSGGGGGFGGAGGTGFVFPNATPGTSGTPVPGGNANGNLATQLEGGSGGGGGSGLVGNAGGGGGGGGGAVALIAGGQISVTGSVHASGGQGGTGYYGGGGGAGGGIIIASLGSSGGTITSTGSLSVAGGNSGYWTPAGVASQFAGGGGGGGRILEYYRQWNVGSGGFAGLNVSAGTYTAGNGAYNGKAGSVVIQADATYISSGNYLDINGSGSSTTLKDSSAGYSIPLTFQTGGFVVNGTGTLTLNNASQTISILSGNGSVVLIGSNLTLDPALSVSSTFSGVISGTGSVTLDGPGNFFLGGNNTFSGGVFADGGTLGVLGNTALGTGSLTIAGGAVYLPTAGTSIANAITLTSGKTDIVVPAAAGGTVTLAGTVGGAGALTVNGAANATLALSAANNYSGGTTINGGILEASGSGTLGSGAVNITSAGTLALSNDNLTISGLTGNGEVALGSSNLTVTNTSGTTDTFSGSISGGGGFIVGGSSPLLLSGNNTYTGGTTINQGASLLISSQNALANAALTNNGNFSLSGGLTSATINGNFIQGSTGVLTTRVSGASPGQFDQFHVTGTANVNGALNVVLENHYDATTSPTVIPVLTSTGASTGNFSSISLGDHPINLFASSVDTGNGINLIFTLQQPSLVPYAITPNQIAVAEYLDSNDGYNHASTPSPDYQQFLNALDSSFSSQIPAYLDLLSPIDLQAFPQVAVQNGINLDQTISSHLLNLDAGAQGLESSGFTMLNPGQQGGEAMALDEMLQNQSRMVTLDAGLPSYLGYSANAPYGSPNQQRWSAFITGAAQFDSYSDTSSIGSSNVTTENATLGADYAIFKYLSVGAFFNYDHSDINLDSFGSTGTVNGYTPGVYADLHMAHWFIDGMAAYTYMDNSESRNIAINYYSATAHGNFSGNSYNGSVDLGYRLYSNSPAFSSLNSWTVVPMISVGYTHADYNSFSETGAGVTGLNVNSMSVDSFRTMLSATFLYTIRLSRQSTIVPGILLGWRHEYLNNSQGITAQLQGAGPGSFTVNTASPVRDVAVIAPSLNINFTKNVSGFVDYELDLG